MKTKYRIVKDSNGLYDVQFRFYFLWLPLSLGQILRTEKEAKEYIIKAKTKDVIVYSE